MLAVAACLLPVAVWSLSRPALLLVLLGASLPLLQSVTGGRLGYQVSISDLLLVLLGTVIVFRAATTGAPEVRALRPVARPVLVYCTIMVLLVPLHLGVENVVQTGQRYELFLAPLVVGAFAALSGRHVLLLQAYVVATTALALVWPLQDFDLQKNPVGQLIANAILLLVGYRPLHRLLPCLVVLVPGLLLTQSRGAIVAAAIGITVVVLMRGLPARQMAIRIVPVFIAAGLTFAAHAHDRPGADHDVLCRDTTTIGRVLDLVSGSVHARMPSASSTPTRGRESALGTTGLRMRRASIRSRTLTTCCSSRPPKGATCSLPDSSSIIAGSFLALVRMRSIALAPVAAGVLLSTAAHGLVDVYWVRGTPVLSWLLVGMVCGLYATRHRDEAPRET